MTPGHPGVETGFLSCQDVAHGSGRHAGRRGQEPGWAWHRDGAGGSSSLRVPDPTLGAAAQRVASLVFLKPFSLDDNRARGRLLLSALMEASERRSDLLFGGLTSRRPSDLRRDNVMATSPALQPDHLGLSPYRCGHVTYLFQKPTRKRDSLAALANHSHRELQAHTQPQGSEFFQPLQEGITLPPHVL